MNTVELVLSPALYPYRQTIEDHNTVVVDILRATTSICTAFQAGAEEVVPLDSLEPLEHYRSLGYTLAAERNAKKVMGAECGNSPTEYMTMDLHGRHLAYSTTNGTVGILLAAKDSAQVFAGGFCNVSALAQRLEGLDSNLVILCSGWKSGVSIEDTLFAGCLIERLNAYRPLNDAAHIAMAAYHEAEGNLYDYCQCGTHIQRLQRMDYDRDIRFAFEMDTCPVVPVMHGSSLTL